MPIYRVTVTATLPRAAIRDERVQDDLWAFSDGHDRRTELDLIADRWTLRVVYRVDEPDAERAERSAVARFNAERRAVGVPEPQTVTASIED